MKDPYVYEGTNVLINLANIKDHFWSGLILFLWVLCWFCPYQL